MLGRLRMGWFRFMRCISWSTSGMAPVHRQYLTKQGRQALNTRCAQLLVSMGTRCTRAMNRSGRSMAEKQGRRALDMHCGKLLVSMGMRCARAWPSSGCRLTVQRAGQPSCLAEVPQPGVM